MSLVRIIEAATAKAGSVKKLAKELGTSEASIYGWRGGGAQPRRATLEALVAYIGETLPVTIDDANAVPVSVPRVKVAPRASPKTNGRPATCGKSRSLGDLVADLETRGTAMLRAAQVLRDLEAACPELFA